MGVRLCHLQSLAALSHVQEPRSGTGCVEYVTHMFSFIWTSSTTRKEKQKENTRPVAAVSYLVWLMSVKEALAA